MFLSGILSPDETNSKLKQLQTEISICDWFDFSELIFCGIVFFGNKIKTKAISFQVMKMNEKSIIARIIPYSIVI